MSNNLAESVFSHESDKRHILREDTSVLMAIWSFFFGTVLLICREYYLAEYWHTVMRMGGARGMGLSELAMAASYNNNAYWAIKLQFVRGVAIFGPALYAFTILTDKVFKYARVIKQPDQGNKADLHKSDNTALHSALINIIFILFGFFIGIALVLSTNYFSMLPSQLMGSVLLGAAVSSFVGAILAATIGLMLGELCLYVYHMVSEFCAVVGPVFRSTAEQKKQICHSLSIGYYPRLGFINELRIAFNCTRGKSRQRAWLLYTPSRVKPTATHDNAASATQITPNDSKSHEMPSLQVSSTYNPSQDFASLLGMLLGAVLSIFFALPFLGQVLAAPSLMLLTANIATQVNALVVSLLGIQQFYKRPLAQIKADLASCRGLNRCIYEFDQKLIYQIERNALLTVIGRALFNNYRLCYLNLPRTNAMLDSLAKIVLTTLLGTLKCFIDITTICIYKCVASFLSNLFFSPKAGAMLRNRRYGTAFLLYLESIIPIMSYTLTRTIPQTRDDWRAARNTGVAIWVIFKTPFLAGYHVILALLHPLNALLHFDTATEYRQAQFTREAARRIHRLMLNQSHTMTIEKLSSHQRSASDPDMKSISDEVNSQQTQRPRSTHGFKLQPQSDADKSSPVGRYTALKTLHEIDIYQYYKQRYATKHEKYEQQLVTKKLITNHSGSVSWLQRFNHLFTPTVQQLQKKCANNAAKQQLFEEAEQAYQLTYNSRLSP